MRLKLRGKLLGAATAVSIITLGMGAIAITSIGSVARQSTVLYERIAVPLEHLYVMDEAYEETRIGLLEAIYGTDPAFVAEQLKGVDEHFAEVRKEASTFESTIITEEARREFADFSAAFAQYEESVSEVRAFDARSDHAGATALLHGRVAEELGLIETALDRILESKVDQAKQRSDENNAVARSTTMKMAMIVAAVFVACFFFGILFAVSFSRPISAAARLAERISEGDLAHGVDSRYKRREDEIGALSVSLEDMRTDLSGSVKEIRDSVDVIQGMSQGLAASAEETAAAVGQIQSAMGSIGGRVVSQSTSVTETSATVDQIIQNINVLNRAIEGQSQSVTESSASIEQMVGNIKSVSRSVHLLGEAFGRLLSASGDGKEKLNAVNDLIKSISTQSEKLFEANSAITDIASQTNLLSMNAAIEAAHAGEAGKGFAVVADEIRKLAENSASKSKEVSGDVRSIKSAIDAVVSSSDAAERSFIEILELIDSLVALEGEIKGAMQEQEQGSQEVLESLGRINEITTRVRQGSTEMAEGSQAIGKEMANLLEQSEALRTDIAEVSRSTEEIRTGTESVSEMSEKNARLIDQVSAKVAKYSLG